jgi:hypothetical protein
MASDIKRFASNSELSFGALIKLDINGYFYHCSDMITGLRAESGLKSTTVHIPLNNKASAREQMLNKNQA